jgi:hypothetical protein
MKVLRCNEKQEGSARAAAKQEREQQHENDAESGFK